MRTQKNQLYSHNASSFRANKLQQFCISDKYKVEATPTRWVVYSESPFVNPPCDQKVCK